VAVVLTAATAVAFMANTAAATPTVPFDVKFSANANGAIEAIGNNLLTCPDGSISTTVAAVPCADTRNGATVNNNSYTMTYLDADSDPSTFNSSSSTLALPVNADVLWAGLYWGARLTAGAGGTSSSATAINQMSLRAPGDTAYRTIPASTAAHDQFGPNTASYSAYQRFAEVTSIVKAAGNGAYWGANVVTGTGEDRYAGWALVVVYSAPGLPLRNLTVFDGFALVQSGSPQNITVSGFKAPLAGAVDAQVSMVAYEGDLGQAGDYARLNNTQLATDISPGSNFFNSTNDFAGASVTTRTPADRNMLGFDIKNLGASGAIGNGDTSAQFQFSSTGDTYYPGVLGLAINLYAPNFTASAKTVVNLNGNNPARPGDTLQYTVNFANTGQDPALDVVSHDVLPPNTTYVPGSLVLLDPVAGPTPLSDSPGNDVGEYLDTTNTVQVRLGNGATATAGGQMACSAPACTDDGSSRFGYSFQVTVDAAASGTTVANTASLDYRTGTTGITATYLTNPASIDVVNVADVSIVKTLAPNPAPAGAPIKATLTVTNHGPDTAGSVTVTDALPSGWTNAAIVSPTGVCSITSGTLTCHLGDLVNGQTVDITLSGATSPSSTDASLTNVATVSTTARDLVPSNNVSSDTITLTRQADLSIVKTASPANAAPGSPVTWTIAATNLGDSDATNVRISDVLDNAGQATISSAQLDATSVTAGGTCLIPVGRGIRCAVPSLAAGATMTMTVSGVLASDLADGVAVGDTAQVSSDTPDPDATNNTATATVTTTTPKADVRMAKSGPATVVAGHQITWTMTATNYGPSDATAVTVTDTVPGGVTGLTATSTRGDPCVISGQRVTCNVGTLFSAGDGVAGGAATVTITGTVPPDKTGTLINEASATTSTTDDPAPGNNTAQASTDVVSLFDLAVTKTANRSSLPSLTPPETRPVDYVITVTNNGPSTASGVTVTDLVPTALEFNSASPSGGGSCTGPVSTSDPDHDRLTCSLTTPIPVGGTQTVNVHMTATTDLATIGDPVTETVSVTAPGDDPTQSANNTATWVLSGTPQADLSLTKSAPPEVTAGTMFSYGFVVANNDPATDPDTNLPGTTASHPIVTDTLPSGVRLVPSGATVAGVASVTPSWCVGDASTPQTVTCTMPAGMDIPPSGSQSFEISVQADAAATVGAVLVNTAHVAPTGSETDPVLDNNTAQAASTVVADADVAVQDFTITPAGSYTGSGSQRQVHFTVVNNGPSTAQTVSFRLTRTVDAIADLSGLPFPASACTAASRELVCTIAATLAPGQSMDIDYVLTIPGDAPSGTFPDSLYVYSSTPDSDPTNNAAAADIVIDSATQTDLAVAKNALGTVPNPYVTVNPNQAFVAGGPFTYQITVQVPPQDPTSTSYVGLADAQNVVLVDSLPTGFVPQQVSSTDGPCDITDPGGTTPAVGGTAIRCVLGTIHSGAGGTTAPAVTVTVSGVLLPTAVSLDGGDDYVTGIDNTATVTTDTPLINSKTQVEGLATVDVINQADLTLVKTPDAPAVNAGGSMGYTLTVINTGPSDVAHAVVTDALPANFTFNATASDCTSPQTTPVDETQAVPAITTGPGAVIACRVGAVAAGASASVHVVADAAYTLASGTATNQATVGSLSPDPDWSNNTASAVVDVTRLTDLATSASVSTTTPAAGQDITFTGFAVNNGPSAAVNTSGTTVFPPGFVPVSVDVPNNICTWDPPPPTDPQTAPWQDVSYTLTCVPAIPGWPWEPGGSATNVVVMHVPGDTPAGTYAGTSHITSDTPETTLSNNDTSLQVHVQHVSDTHVTKTLISPNPMVAGQPATWRLTAVNDGPSVADNVVISDAVPPGMSYASATIEGGAACPAPGVESGQVVMRCPVAQLDIGDANAVSVLVTFNVNGTTTGQNLCNTAFVGSGSLDPDALNNQSQACGVTVAGPPGGGGSGGGGQGGGSGGGKGPAVGTGGSAQASGPQAIGFALAAMLLVGAATAALVVRQRRPAHRLTT